MSQKKKFVLALIKHETNTFSPVPTPITAFGHGAGPMSGSTAIAAHRGSNQPFAAYLDIAEREGAEIVVPIVAESWPSNAATRDTFEALVRPLEDAVRAGCDALFIDLHGAMVVHGFDDAEGEILRRVRAIAPDLPIAVTLDYHTNLSPAMVANATVITGYKTYPHVDMYEVGALAATLLVRALKGEIRPMMAYRWLPLLASVMRHAPEDGPAGDIVAYARAMERNGTVLAATLLPSFPHADTPFTGTSAVVVTDGDQATAQAVADHMVGIAWQRRDELVLHAPPLVMSVARAKQLGQSPQDGPILLIDHCDNCGSGGAQDVMAVVAEILRQGLEDVAIAPIRDAAAVAQMIAAGVGSELTLALGGKTDMPSIALVGKPLTLTGRVRAITDGEVTITGPMYTGLKTHLGRTAVLDTGAVQIVVTERHHEPYDLAVFEHCGIDPRRKKFIMLKSRIHYRAAFKPLASHIVECAGEGVTNADLNVYTYEKLVRPIYPLDELSFAHLDSPPESPR
jgi:microcystin degradation protein MlrC